MRLPGPHFARRATLWLFVLAPAVALGLVVLPMPDPSSAHSRQFGDSHGDHSSHSRQFGEGRSDRHGRSDHHGRSDRDSSHGRQFGEAHSENSRELRRDGAPQSSKPQFAAAQPAEPAQLAAPQSSEASVAVDPGETQPAEIQVTDTQPADTTQSAENSSSTATGDVTVTTDEAMATEVTQLVNGYRRQAGCSELKVDSRLTSAALQHSQDMIARDYFDHDSPDGGTSSERAAAAGYHSPTGENIAGGDESASEVVQTWMDSPGHRANILDCDYHSTGVGLARGGKYGTYWTQMFGYA